MLILDTFDMLPNAVLKTQRCYELFPENLLLRDRALSVYLDILSMIESMITSLVDKSLRQSNPAFEDEIWETNFRDSRQG